MARTRLAFMRPFTTRVVNSFTRLVAGRLPWFAIIHQRGRQTGRRHDTPVNVFRHGADHFPATECRPGSMPAMTMDMRMPPLETDRLRIRPFEQSDLPAVCAILEADGTDPTTERYVRHGALNAVVLAELMQPPLGDRAVELRSTGEVVGVTGLVPAYGPFDQLRPMGELQPDATRASLYRIEIGLYYAVHPMHRRQGHASAAARALVDFAFDRLRLGRIVATTERGNAASQAVMRRLGMRLHENALPEPAWFQVVGIAERS